MRRVASGTLVLTAGNTHQHTKRPAELVLTASNTLQHTKWPAELVLTAGNTLHTKTGLLQPRGVGSRCAAGPGRSVPYIGETRHQDTLLPSCSKALCF